MPTATPLLPGRPANRVRRLRTSLPVLSLTALLCVAGCDGGGAATASRTAVSQSPPPAAAPALNRSAAKKFYAGFDVTRNAALTTATSGRRDSAQLKEVFGPPMLDQQLLRAELLRLTGRSHTATGRTAVDRSYTGVETPGPQDVLVTVTARGSDSSGGGAELLRRGDAQAQWQVAAHIPVELRALSDPVAPQSNTVTDAEYAAVQSAVTRAMAYLEGGTRGGVIFSADAAEIRDRDQDLQGSDVSVKVRVWSKDPGTPTPGGPIVVVKTKTGLMAIALLRVRSTVRSTTGATLALKDPYPRLLGLPRKAKSYRYESATSLLIKLDKGKKPVVVGAGGGGVLGTS